MSEAFYICDRKICKLVTISPREHGKGLYMDFSTNKCSDKLWHMAHAFWTLPYRWPFEDYPQRHSARTAKNSASNQAVRAGCVIGKPIRMKLPNEATSRAQLEPLDLMHSDVCGTFQTVSLAGARYIIIHVRWWLLLSASYSIATFGERQVEWPSPLMFSTSITQATGLEPSRNENPL